MRRLGFWIALCALAAASPARSNGQAPQKVTSVEGITEYRLSNGLRVLLYPDSSRPKVTVNLTVMVGSRHEGYGETGMAHLLEHMVFKGTPTHPDIPGAMKERGAQFNGSTWFDRTNYYETLPASDENLEFALRLEADRMMNSPIKAEDLATEFSVVRNEFEMGENSPRGVLDERMQSAAFLWHNYGKSTIGNRSDIERVPVDNLRAFYRKFYQPDNALLIVAGKFDEEKALAYINKYFGSLPKPDRKLDPTYTEEPAQDGERAVTLRRVGDVGIAGLLYHVPASSHPEYSAVQILAQVMGDEPSGRLYKALVETRKATDVSAGAGAFHDPGVLQFFAEVDGKDQKTIEALRDSLIEIVEGVASKGFTAEEVDRARQKLLKNRELSASDPNRIAIELSDWAAQGDWRLYFIARDRVEKVTPEQVTEVAAKYLRPSNRTVGLFIPTSTSDRTPIPASPEIASLVDGYKGREARSAGEVLDDNPTAIQARVRTPEPVEGVKIALLPKKTSGESVHLTLTLHYGDEQSLKGLVDASGFLPELMMRGTKNLTRQQLQDALDKNFVRFGGGGGGRGMMGALAGGGGAGSITFSLQTKRANLPAAIDLMRQILREPALSAEEFETLKRSRISQLESGRSEPMLQGINRLMRTLSPYPPTDVRYVPTIDEQIARVKETTLEQVQAVYKDFLGAGHGELAVVGDFDAAEVPSLLTPVFQGWKAQQPFKRIDRPYQELSTGVRDTIETPDKANASYFAGLLIPIKDSDAAYPALVAGNYVLGGGSLSSRIADRLRQKGGLSYSAASNFNASPLDERGMLMALAIYNPENRAKVIEGVDEEIARLLSEGVKPEELESAKKGWLEQQKIQRTNDPGLAAKLAQNLYLGRTLKFDADVETAMQGLTPQAVNDALRKFIDPKKLNVITAGDFTGGDKKKLE
jgi:zinc protease